MVDGDVIRHKPDGFYEDLGMGIQPPLAITMFTLCHPIEISARGLIQAKSRLC